MRQTVYNERIKEDAELVLTIRGKVLSLAEDARVAK